MGALLPQLARVLIAGLSAPNILRERQTARGGSKVRACARISRGSDFDVAANYLRANMVASRCRFGRRVQR